MAKTYQIHLNIDAAQARTTAQLVQAELKKVEIEAGKLALAQERAANRGADAQARAAKVAEQEAQRAATATERAAKKLADAQAREANRAGNAQAREAAAATRVAEREARVQEKAAKNLADTQAREMARATRAAEKETRAQAMAAEKAARLQAKAVDETTSRYNSLSGAMMGVAAQQFGLSRLSQVVGSIGEGFKKAAEDARKLADEVANAQEELIALASIQGKPIDNKFVLEHADFQAATAMGAPQARSFRENFMGSGAQNIGKSISEKEGSEFERLAGSLSASTGIEPDVMGKLSGSLLGFQDFNKEGDKGAEAALGKFYQAIKVAQRGKGENAVLARQMEMLASASLNEDELKGTFTDMTEVATAISIGAEYHDAASAEMVRATIKGIHKPTAMTKRAGITDKTPFFDAMKKLGDVAKTEALDKGIDLEAFVRDNFHDELTQRGVLTFLNRGVYGGAIKDRQDFAKTIGTPEAMADIEKFQTDTEGPGPRLIKQAELRKTRLSQGVPTTRLDPLFLDAENRLKRDREIDRSTPNAVDAVTDKLNIGYQLGFGKGSRDTRILEGVMSDLGRRAKSAGVDLQFPKGLSGTSIENQTFELTRAVRQIRAAGGDPFRDGPGTVGESPADTEGPGPRPIEQDKERKARLSGEIADERLGPLALEAEKQPSDEKAIDATPGGAEGGRRRAQASSRARELLDRRDVAAGIERPPALVAGNSSGGTDDPNATEGQTARMNGQNRRIRVAGGDPFLDSTGPGGNPTDPTQQRQLDVLERIERNTAGGPRPLPASPRGGSATMER